MCVYIYIIDWIEQKRMKKKEGEKGKKISGY